MLHRLVSDGELTQVVTAHFRFDFYLVECLAFCTHLPGWSCHKTLKFFDQSFVILLLLTAVEAGRPSWVCGHPKGHSEFCLKVKWIVVVRVPVSLCHRSQEKKEFQGESGHSSRLGREQSSWV